MLDIRAEPRDPGMKGDMLATAGSHGDPQVRIGPEVIEEWKRSPMCPAHGEVTFVGDYEEGVQVLRSRAFRTNRFTAEGTNPVWVVVGEDRSVRFAATDGRGDPTEPAVDWATVLAGADTLSSLQGEEHKRRRRALSPIFGRGSHRWYHDTAIGPTIGRSLQGALDSADEDGVVHVDLVPFTHRLFVQLTAGLVGLDGVEDDERADALADLFERMHEAAPMTVPADALTEAAMTDALAARDEFKQRFVDPSQAAREELVARSRRGEIGEEELPRDYLTLVAKGADTFDSAETVLNQAFPLFSGSTGTSTLVVLHMLQDLFAWHEEHPEIGAIPTDPDFLEHALAETIRLQNPGLPFITRFAVEDSDLAGGRHVDAGEVVNLYLPAVNEDPAAFGEDAHRFDPTRETPAGIPAYGLGFGGGVHMCPATPLVLGEGGISGTIVPTVAALLRAGAEPDPDRPPVRRPEIEKLDPTIESFPVLLHRR